MAAETADVRSTQGSGAHLQEEEADYANRMGYSKHDPARPLYTRDDAWRAVQRLHPIPFHTEHEIVPGVVQSLKVVTDAACRRFFRFALNWARGAVCTAGWPRHSQRCWVGKW